MNPPQSYAEWSNCFDAMKGGLDDEAVLAAMERGGLSWSSGVAERFCSQFFELIDHRLEGASKRLQRSVDLARGNETALVSGLMGMRRELKLLMRLCSLSAIPPEKRSYFAQQVTETAGRIQESLENSAKQDRSGRLASLIKNNRVNAL